MWFVGLLIGGVLGAMAGGVGGFVVGGFIGGLIGAGIGMGRADRLARLEARVEKIEQQWAQLRAGGVPGVRPPGTEEAPAAAEAAASAAHAPAPAEAASVAAQELPDVALRAPLPQPVESPSNEWAEARASNVPLPETPSAPTFLSRLVTENIVAKVGVVVLFLGVGFLLKFAYDRGMLPPELRLVGVGALAVALFLIGWRLRESRHLYAMILQGAASGIAYLDVFFALKTYGFIGPAVAFSLFALLGVATTMLAVRQDAVVLAVLGLIGAFSAPILAATGAGNHVLLFSYYALLNLFILGVSWFKAWRSLNLTGWFFTFAVALAWGANNYRPELFGTVEPFVLLFFALYLVIPILFATHQPPALKGVVDGTLVFGTPAAVAVMQAGLVRDMPYGLAWSAAVGAALYAVLAALVWRRESMRLLRETYLALAVGLGTLAIFFGFDAYPTFALWTLEGTAILWVGLRQRHALARWFGLAVQLAGAILFLTEYAPLERAHAVFNDAVYGCLWIAVAGMISATLLRRYAECLAGVERNLATLMLLWGALWWSIGGLDAIDHAVARPLQPAAAGIYFALSFLAADIAGSRSAWIQLRALAVLHAPVLAVAALAQIVHGGHALGDLGWLAWPVGFGIAFWTLLQQERAGIAVASAPRYAVLWGTLAVLATWEQWWLLREGRHSYGMLLAAAGHAAAWLRFHLRERRNAAAVPASMAVLLWAMAFWFVHGGIWADERFAHAGLISAGLGLAAATTLAYELAGKGLGWPVLRHASLVLWAAMLAAALAQLQADLRPWASFGWLAWPAALALGYWSLHRQERDAGAAAVPARHALGLWLLAFLVGRELTARFTDWGLGTAWISSAWGFSLAAALGGAVAWGERGHWPVAPHRDHYRGTVLGPLGLLGALWLLHVNFRAPGTMSPLPYLPLANPIDLGAAATLGAVLMWSRWFASGHAGAGAIVRRAAWALGFVCLNGIALRSIHFWADVPYRVDRLLASVLVQATLSLLWTGAAMALMLLARRNGQRPLWVLGAALLAVVVGKLFLVDLANTGTVARIVSFMGVGALLLVIGYVAPVPPAEKAESAARGAGVP